MNGSSQSKGNSSTSLRAVDEVCADLAALLERSPLSLILNALSGDTSLHLVGGAVRDTFTGQKDFDFDLTTALSADVVLQRLQTAGIRAIDLAARHGTIVAAVDEHNVEITTFRKLAPNGAVVAGTNLTEDLALRDFTINAVAFSVHQKQFVDPLNGIADLARNVLRAPEDPAARFAEDPLRLLRMIRFGPASGRVIETNTLNAAAARFKLLSGVSVERIRDELELILISQFPAQAFRVLKDLGALEFVLPELIPAIGVDQNEFHTEDVFDHTLSVIERAPADRLLRWTALFHDLGKVPTRSVGEDGRIHFYGHEQVSTRIADPIMDRLKFSHLDRQRIELLVREHMRPLNCGVPGTRRILRDLGGEYDRWREFKIADAPPRMPDDEFSGQLARFDKMVEAERQRRQGSVYGKLAINGDDLIRMGVPPGPKLGALLKRADEAVLENPELNERDALLAFLGKLLKE